MILVYGVLVGVAGIVFLASTVDPRRLYATAIAILFGIYVIVSLVGSELPLLIVDGITATLLLQTASLRRAGGVSAFGGSRLIATLTILYVTSVVAGLASDNIVSWVAAARGARTLLFGVCYLFLSTVWIDTPATFDRLLRVVVIGTIAAVVWGFRQLAFGLFPYELARLAIAGSALQELNTMGRLRVPSSFGVPTAYAFVTLTTALLLPIAARRGSLQWLRGRRIWLVESLIIAGLFTALMRGAVVGLAAGATVAGLLGGSPLARRVLKVAFSAAALVVGLFLIISLHLDVSGNRILHAVGTSAQSAWSAIPFLPHEVLSEQQQRLASYSVSVRTGYLREVLTFLSERPLGAGVGTVTTGQSRYVVLPTIDMGFVRVGAELGWVGFVAYVGLFVGVGWIGFLRYRAARTAVTRHMGRWLLALWVAYGVAMSTNGYFETEVLAMLGWSMGGVLLNLHRFELEPAIPPPDIV